MVALIGSILIHVVRTQWYEDWVTVPGEVTQVEFTISGTKHGSGKRHEIHYVYYVDGKTYMGSEVFNGWETEVSAGDKAEIWIDPENVELSCYAKPGPGLNQFAPFFIGAPLMLAAFLYFRRKNI